MSYLSHADLGGRSGYGRVLPEPEGEYFHAAWEPRVLALTLALGAGGGWNIDMSRAARETLPNYARLGYYEIWFEALLKLLAEREWIGADELAAGRALHAAPAPPRTLRAADVPAVLAKGAPTARPAAVPARFAPGQAVRLFAGEVPHHTRLPGYMRGQRGTIERVHGAHVFADAHASGRGEQPQWLYTVVVDAAQLWRGASHRVSVDAWEPYLAPA
jgi:nitrile hydratase subunit beta